MSCLNASPHCTGGGSTSFWMNITLSVSQYIARCTSLSRWAYKYIRPPHATNAAMISLVSRRLGTCSSAIYLHEAQTPWLANKFTSSTPGVAKNFYISFGSEFILGSILPFSQFSQSDFKHGFARPRLAALGLIASFSNRTPSLAYKVSTYRSLSSGVRTQLGYPQASALSLRNVYIFRK